MPSGPLTDVKVLATGRAAGILIDATVIRVLIVPALVTMFSRWNWCFMMAGPDATRAAVAAVAAVVGDGGRVSS